MVVLKVASLEHCLVAYWGAKLAAKMVVLKVGTTVGYLAVNLVASTGLKWVDGRIENWVENLDYSTVVWMAV